MRRVWRDVPLTVRVPLLAAILMAALGLLASQIVLARLDMIQAHRVQAVTEARADGIMLAVAAAAERMDVWEVYDALDKAARKSGGALSRATVLTPGGEVIASSDPRADPTGVSRTVLRDAAPDIGSAGAEATVTRTPLRHQDREVGTLILHLDPSAAIAERDEIRQALLLGNAGLTFLLCVATWVVMGRLLRPLSRISTNLRASGAEPMPLREVAQGAGPELRALVRAHDDMAMQLRAGTELRRRLAEQDRYVGLGRLAATLAHEINNPLGGLLNAVDTMQRFPDRMDVQSRTLDLLQRGLRHLRDVTSAALDPRKLQAEAALLTHDDVEDLRRLIESEVRRLGQSLDWHVSPGARTNGILPVLAAPVRQVALNLLLNASAAASRGGSLRLVLEDHGDVLELSVEDDGPGLPPERIAMLRGQSEMAAEPGFGLRYVRDIILEHGGELLYARTDGRTTITARFPLRAEEVAA